MQYNLQKDLVEKTKAKVQWHGAPTRVLVHGESQKRSIATGDTLSVTVKQARELLTYSPLWTLDGDEPSPQPYRNRDVATVQEEEKEVEVTNENDAPKLTEKEQVMADLRALNVTFNDAASTDELKQLLADALSV